MIHLGSFSFDLADIGTTAGLLVMAAGVWMGARQQRLRWDVEEAIKNQKITEEEARKRIAWITWRPVGFVVLGLVVVVVAIAMLKS